MRACSHRQQTLNACVLGSVDDDGVAQVALGFRRFLAHQVAHSRPVALDFTRAGHFETLLRAGVGLHFWHGNSVFKKLEREGNADYLEMWSMRLIFFKCGQCEECGQCD